MPLSPEFSQGRSQHPINESLRNKLVGQPGWASREPRLQTEQPRNFTSALPIDNEALARLSKEKRQEAEQQLMDLAELLPQLSPDETNGVWNEALQVQNVAEIYPGSNRERSPLYLAVLRMLAALLLLGILTGGFAKSAEAASPMPTVTPTPSSENQPKTATPIATTEEEEENQLPTVTPTPKATSIPRATATPEVTVIPEVSVDYAVVNGDGTNLRQGPSTDTAKVGVANSGDRFKMTGEEEQVGAYTWYEVYTEEDSTIAKGWLRGDLITVKTETVPAPVQPSEAITQTQPITNSEVITQGVVDTEAVGGTISEQALESRAKEIFGADVVIEVDKTRMYPIAKIDKFVVGEFLGGEWQQIQEIKILSEEQLSWYPDTEEKVVDGKKVIVQTKFGADVVIAEENAEGKWQQPSMTSLELTRLAQEASIKTITTSGKKEHSSSPIPYEYNINALPEIELDANGEIIPISKDRKIIVRGMATSSPQAIYLPITKEVNGQKIDTGWSIYSIVLPTASVSKQGEWTVNNIIIGDTAPLVSPKGEVFGYTFLVNETEIVNGSILYNELDNSSSESLFASSNLPRLKAEEVVSEIVPGTPVGLYIFSAIKGDPQEWNEYDAGYEELIGDFDYQPDSTPNSDQAFAASTRLRYELTSEYSIGNYFLFDDKSLLEMSEDGGKERSSELRYWGTVTNVNKMNTE